MNAGEVRATLDREPFEPVPFLHLAAIESISNGWHPKPRRRKPRE
jgi:hypothetical protein